MSGPARENADKAATYCHQKLSTLTVDSSQDKPILTRLERVIVRRVERSLYQRANGYNYEAVKVFMPAGSKQPVVVHYTEHCPPDVTAAFIWLKNRDPDRWRDVQNVEHVLGKYLISDHPMTVEQWAAERATVVNEVVIDDTTGQLPAPKKDAT
jgi:hypothetical protein